MIVDPPGKPIAVRDSTYATFVKYDASAPLPDLLLWIGMRDFTITRCAGMDTILVTVYKFVGAVH